VLNVAIEAWQYWRCICLCCILGLYGIASLLTSHLGDLGETDRGARGVLPLFTSEWKAIMLTASPVRTLTQDWNAVNAVMKNHGEREV